MIRLTIDKKPINAPESATILEAARSAGIEIPTFCAVSSLTPSGKCRVCLVEVTYSDGTRLLTSACDTPVAEDMRVRTKTDAVRNARKQSAAILLSLAPDRPKIQRFAAKLGVIAPSPNKNNASRFTPVLKPTTLTQGACIQCGLCVQACAEKAGGILQLTGKGTDRRVSLPDGKPSDACIGCNRCIAVCPTGAITRDLGLGIGRDIAQKAKRRENLRRFSRFTFLILWILTILPFIVPEVPKTVPTNLFDRLNPLRALVGLISAAITEFNHHGLNEFMPATLIAPIRYFAPAFVLTALTFLFGRFWCGWMCPLGTITTLFGNRGRKVAPSRLRRLKTILFFTILVFTFVGSMSLMIFDPQTVLAQFASGIAKTVSEISNSNDLTPDKIRFIASLCMPFVIVLLLSALVERGAFCRYVCPLGGLLGCVAKQSVVKRVVDEESCIECGQCANLCELGAIAPANLYASDPGECSQCGACQTVCPKHAIHFHNNVPEKELRREFPVGRVELIGTAALVLVLILLNLLGAVR